VRHLAVLKIDSAEIIDTVHGRPSPMISASAGRKIDR
jgi:hypothetical protein